MVVRVQKPSHVAIVSPTNRLPYVQLNLTYEVLNNSGDSEQSNFCHKIDGFMAGLATERNQHRVRSDL